MCWGGVEEAMEEMAMDECACVLCVRAMRVAA